MKFVSTIRFALFATGLMLTPSSYAETISEAVINVLKSKHQGSQNKTWFVSTANFDNNWLEAAPFNDYLGLASMPRDLDCDPSDYLCDDQFKRKICETDMDCLDQGVSCQSLDASVSPNNSAPISMCLNPADKLVDRFYNLITSTDQHLDITSLSAPTGRFYEGVINGLAELSLKPTPPTVRLLFSGQDSVKPNFLNDPNKVLASIIRDIDRVGGKGSQLPMNLAWLSSPQLSWNHSKIAISDQNRMINGGHNLWDSDYLSDKPVFDLSLELEGVAAQQTQGYVDLLWSKTRRYAASSGAGRIMPTRLDSVTEGASQVIGVGRMGVFGNNAADDAIVAMIEAANSSIYMSQQDLFSALSWKVQPSWAAKSLVEAALRGVKIKIVTSNKGPFLGYGMVSSQESLDLFVKMAKKLPNLKDYGLSPSAAAEKVCDSMEIAPFRFNDQVQTWTDGAAIANHSKLIIADEQTFYLGSQNFYPANLQEHGLIVSDAEVTESLLGSYWDDLWQASQNSRVNCR